MTARGVLSNLHRLELCGLRACWSSRAREREHLLAASPRRSVEVGFPEVSLALLANRSSGIVQHSSRTCEHVPLVTFSARFVGGMCGRVCVTLSLLVLLDRGLDRAKCMIELSTYLSPLRSRFEVWGHEFLDFGQ